MENLARFLKPRRVKSKSGPHNLVSLRKGKWNVLPCDRSEFFNLYKIAAQTFSPSQNTAFVYRPPTDEMQPLYIDVDIKTATEIDTLMDMHHTLAIKIAGLLEKEGAVDYMLVQKPSGYWKKVNNENVFCTGSHILFPGTHVSTDRAEKIRLAASEYISEIFGHLDLVNSNDDVLDKRITNRANGLMFLYDYKGNGCGGQYQVKLVGSLSQDHTFCEYKGDEYLEHLDMEMIYGFAFRRKRIAKITPVLEQQESSVMQKTTVSGEKTNLQLGLYMEALGDWVPSEELYVKLIMFFSNTNLAPEYIADMCNRYWSPPGHQATETINMLHKYRGRSTVTRGTAQWILQRHARNTYNLNKIFPAKIYRHYNEYTSFVGKLNRRQDVKEFLRQVVGYVFKGKKYTWTAFTTVRDKHGRMIKNVDIYLSKNPPFSKSDDLRVKVFPSRSDLIEALESKVSVRTKDKAEIQLYTKIHKVLNTAAELPIEELFGKTKTLLAHKCPMPEFLLMSKVLSELQLSHELTRYCDIIFKPFPGKETYVDKSVLNTFTGFPFEYYTPKCIIDVKATQIWKFLVDVYGEGDEGPLLDHILNMFAHLVQKPQIRSERITAIISAGEGTGKSTWFHLLQMVLSAQYCKFHASLKPFLRDFNIGNIGRLVHWCDDISASSQKETRLLFSRATSHTQKYEAKGETSLEIAEFSNLYITANEECPLHTHPKDRRQQIIVAGESHIQDRKFFAKVYLEMESLDVGYAFYNFFKHRDLGEWTPASEPPTDAKRKTIACCIKKSHTFLNEFFVDMDWIISYIPQYKTWSSFLKKIEAHVMARGDRKGQLRIRIEYQIFYGLYRAFMKANYPASRARNIDTFCKETALLGICKSDKRQSVNKNNYVVVDLFYQSLSAMWKNEYPTVPFHVWDSVINRKEFMDNLTKFQVVQNKFTND